MQNLFRRWLPAVLVMAMLGGSALAQGRLATVDLQKLFDTYWKTKQASAELEDQARGVQKEDKSMMDDYKSKKDDYQALVTASSDPNVAPGERDKRRKAAEDKLKQLKDLEDTIVQYERQANTMLAEKKQQMRTKILNEIRNIVNAKAKAGGFAMVVDTAAKSGDGTPVVLFTNNENDLTSSVLEELNRTAPTDIPRADDKPALVPDDKKATKK